MSDVIVITPDESFESTTRAALDEWGDIVLRVWSEDWNEIVQGVDDIAAESPQAVVIGPGIDESDALTLAEFFDTRHPEISIVMVGDAYGNFLREAMRVGARGVIEADAAIGELKTTLVRAATTSRRRRRSVDEVTGERSSNSGRVITVVSPKGGSGKTTIGCNLAVGLADRGKNVVVVDLDLLFGDVATTLGIDPEQTIASASRQMDKAELNTTTLKAHLTRHQSGVYVLAAPMGLDDVDRVSADHVKTILDLLADEFEFVVIDTASGFDDITLVAMEHGLDLLMICTTDLPSIRGMRRQIEALDQISLVSQRRHLVVNRSDARGGLTAADVEAALGMAASGRIPSSQRVALAGNEGRPFVTTRRRDGASRGVVSLCDLFDNDKKAGQRFWRKDS
jgi:pilus assembly protein CpaE